MIAQKKRVPFEIGANPEDDAQGDAQVQVAVLDGQTDHEATEEHHDGLGDVAAAHSARIHDAEQREHYHRYQARHCQRPISIADDKNARRVRSGTDEEIILCPIYCFWPSLENCGLVDLLCPSYCIN